MQSMTVQGTDIQIKEYQGKRVVTFKDIDAVHQRPEGTARKRFNDNKQRFISGVDFFKVRCSEVRPFFGQTLPNGFNPNADIVLVTQQGYTMLTKSLTDDLAWAVQRELVNNYFNKPDTPDISSLSPQTQAMLSQTQAIIKLELRQNQQAEELEKVNADLQEFKQDIPLLGVEEIKVSNAVKKKGVDCLGGKQSAAYGDNSIRGKVYADIHRQLKREFGVTTYKAIKRRECDLAIGVVEAYELPYVLQEEINAANKQIVM